jgi:hypothetical protein
MGMARGGLTRSREGHEGLWGGWRARGWPRNDTDDHGMGIGRARAQRSGARYRNRCARYGAVGGSWRAGVKHEDSKGAKVFKRGLARGGFSQRR